MIITKMGEQHIAQIAELEKLCFSDPWSEKSVASELSNPLAFWLVADDNGRVAGYIGSQTVMGETDMMNVAVHPDYRNHGIATGLIVGLVEELRKMGSHCLTLEVRASNENAIRVYRRLDFQEVGRRKNYYRNPKEDALILRKEWEI